MIELTEDMVLRHWTFREARQQENKRQKNLHERYNPPRRSWRHRIKLLVQMTPWTRFLYMGVDITKKKKSR